MKPTHHKAWYEQHLQSPEWKAMRAKVMERAGGVCEGCRERSAVHVHHLTYAHAGKELAFELVALCDGCHAKAHDLKADAENDAKPTTRARSYETILTALLIADPNLGETARVKAVKDRLQSAELGLLLRLREPRDGIRYVSEPTRAYLKKSLEEMGQAKGLAFIADKIAMTVELGLVLDSLEALRPAATTEPDEYMRGTKARDLDSLNDRRKELLKRLSSFDVTEEDARELAPDMDNEP
jgi:hypothetical protein